jgi:hypothetical protein
VPPADRIQHISGWAAGYGLPEASAFLRGEAEKGEINVARFDARGPANDGLNVYLNATKSLHMYTLNGREPNVAAEALGLAKSRRTLFVSNPAEEQMRGIARRACLGNATRIWVYDRPGSESQLEIWELPRFRAGK